MNIQKYIFLYAFICFLINSAPAQTGWKANATYGFLMAHRESIAHLPEAHSYGVEINSVWNLKEDNPWRIKYVSPTWGIAGVYLSGGSKETIGNIFALQPYIDLPLGKINKKKHVNLHFAIGLGYIEKPFERIQNYKNIAIGSHLNAAITAGFHLAPNNDSKWQHSYGLTFYHYSNGAFKPPNLGLNYLTLCYNVSIDPKRLEKQFKADELKVLNEDVIDVTLSGGIKETSIGNNDKFGMISLSVDYLKGVSWKTYIIGGGYISNNSAVTNQHQFGGDNLEGGLHTGIAMSFGKATPIFTVGYYLKSEGYLKGKIYNRLAIRRKIGKDVFIQFGLKNHIFKAEYVEVGLGYRFNR